MISFGLCAFYYGRMPAQMPVHWDAAGHVNGLLLLPVVSPKGFRIDQFMGTDNLVVPAIIAIMFFTSALAFAAAAGYGT